MSPRQPLKFRTVVMLWVCGILYLSLILATGFFLKLYTAEKIGNVFENEIALTSQFGLRLENLFLTASDLDPSKVLSSKEIILMQENACSGGGKTVVSNWFSKALAQAKFPVQELSAVSAFPGLQIACDKFAANPKEPVLFGTSQSFIVPALFSLVPEKAEFQTPTSHPPPAELSSLQLGWS